VCAKRPVASGRLWAGPRAIVLTLWTRVRTIRPDWACPNLPASGRAAGWREGKPARSRHAGLRCCCVWPCLHSVGQAVRLSAAPSGFVRTPSFAPPPVLAFAP